MKTEGAMWRAYKMSAPEWYFIVLGMIGAAMNGVAMPIFAIVFGNVLQVLLTSKTSEQMMNSVDFWAGMFVVIVRSPFILFYLFIYLFIYLFL